AVEEMVVLQGHEDRDRTPARSHFQSLAGLDPTQDGRDVLLQRPHPDPLHVRRCSTATRRREEPPTPPCAAPDAAVFLDAGPRCRDGEGMTRPALAATLLLALAAPASAICTANVGGSPRACPAPPSGRPAYTTNRHDDA